MALSYRIYPADTQIAPQLVTSNVIDPNTILGLHQGRNGFANLIICIAEAWYLEKIRELTENRDNAIIDKWWTNYNASLIGQPWCEVFSAAIIGEAIKECGVTNLYPKSSDKVRIYKKSDNKIPSYNWELLDKEIRDNKLKQVQDVISANAFRASVYLIDNLRKYNVKVSSEPTPGSRFYRYSTGSGSSGHAGIVIAIKDGFFYTIEGNVYLDAQKLSQGVGMYRYPIAAAQNQATGFTFFDFSSYPSGMGNISCESKDFSYTYTGLDGKTKTRKCYKPPTPPKDVTEDPPGEKPPVDKPPGEKPPTEKPPCDPPPLVPNDPPEVKKAKCEKFVTVKIPDKGLLQHYSQIRELDVELDITKRDKFFDPLKNRQYTLTGVEIEKRNGSALWYGKNKKDINTGKATGFGMFKDSVGNMIYVLDANNQESNQLVLSGLLGFNMPDIMVDKNADGTYSWKSGWSLGAALYHNRRNVNYFGISLFQSKIENNDIPFLLKLGAVSTTNGLYNNTASRDNWRVDEKPNKFLYGSNYKLGLDFKDTIDNEAPMQDSHYEYNIPYIVWTKPLNTNVSTIAVNENDGAILSNNSFVNLYNILDYIEKNNIILKKPIVLVVNTPPTKKPLIGQDFIGITSTVLTIATSVVGIPIPVEAIINGLNFANNLNKAASDGKFNFTEVRDLAQQAYRITKSVAPDFIKGIEKDTSKFLRDEYASAAQLVGGALSGNKDTNLEKTLNKFLTDGRTLLEGEIKYFGKHFVSARDAINASMGTLNGVSAGKLLGLSDTQTKQLTRGFDNIMSGATAVVDLRDILSGEKFKDVQKNVATFKTGLVVNKVLQKFGGAKAFDVVDDLKQFSDYTNSPIMQELLINASATNIIGMFPKAPQLASVLLQPKNNAILSSSYSELLANTKGVLQKHEEKANMIAGAFGFNNELCDPFAPEILKSLETQATEYALKKIPFFMPPSMNGDQAECFRYEISKIPGVPPPINCPEGWNYDVKSNKCYPDKPIIGYEPPPPDKITPPPFEVPKCIQSSFGTYVFYFRGIPLAAMKSTDGKWIAAWGGKNYFIDVDKCQLMGVPPETDKPSNEPPTPPAIPLPKCITIRNGKYYYNLRYAVGLSDGLISKELTDLFANTKTPIGGASPQDLLNYANAIGIDTSKVTNNPTVSSAIKTVDKVDNLINTLKTTSSNPIITTSSPTGSPIVANNPVTSNVNSVTSASNTNKPILNVTQAASEEEAYYMNGKWYLLRGGKYVEIIDCIPVAAKVYKCGIIERDGEFIFTKNGAEYKAVKNFDNDFYVFINGQYYQLDANCNPITPKPGTKECDECEKLVEVEKQNRIKLEKAFSESKVSNDSKIKELINLLNIQTQKSLELEKQIILRSGSSTTNNDSKYNELLTQLQNERERVNQLSKLIEQSKTGGNNNDSVIREIIISLNQEKERSQKLEQKISELEQMKSDNSSSNDSREYFNNLDNFSKEKSFEKEISTEKEKLPNCITIENGKYYFTGMVQNDTLKLIALNTAKGWVASYQSSYYMIDLANCKLLTGNLRGETNITGECTDCVQNTQPRIVERSEKIVYGGFKQGLDPEVYEDCDDCE